MSISLVFLRAEPASFSRAAARFHARVILESGKAPAIRVSQDVLTALHDLAGGDQRAAASDLADVVEELELPKVAARLDAWLKPQAAALNSEGAATDHLESQAR